MSLPNRYNPTKFSMAKAHPVLVLSCELLLVVMVVVVAALPNCLGFQIKEATIDDIQLAFRQNKLNSTELVRFYLKQIRTLNPLLHAVIEVNPDVVRQAGKADHERLMGCGPTSKLHGIPILLKDNIATADRLNTTAGSFALLGSVVRRDAGVVTRLRKAGAIILGKASLSEWAYFRSSSAPNGWCGRGGQGKNPYVLSWDPCGSSSGSAIAMAANLATVSLGTETDGSIICPSSLNSVVGIKPTVGLTSRSGVIPISPRQDTVGPMCRTVSDAVYVLDTIVGFDPWDELATKAATKFIPSGGYNQFLKVDGLNRKRLGILRGSFDFNRGSIKERIYKKHFITLRKKGALLLENLEIANLSIIQDSISSGENTAMLAEFKLSINSYLSNLVGSPVRSLADLITFNLKHSKQEHIEDYGQDTFLQAQNTSGFGEKERNAVHKMLKLSQEGLERLMREKNLDAVVEPDASISSVLAIGGYPGISVPAGYDDNGVPFAISFGGISGSEPKLIEIAYSFEQATKIRKPPSFKP